MVEEEEELMGKAEEESCMEGSWRAEVGKECPPPTPLPHSPALSLDLSVCARSEPWVISARAEARAWGM